MKYYLTRAGRELSEQAEKSPLRKQLATATRVPKFKPLSSDERKRITILTKGRSSRLRATETNPKGLPTQ